MLSTHPAEQTRTHQTSFNWTSFSGFEFNVTFERMVYIQTLNDLYNMLIIDGSHIFHAVCKVGEENLRRYKTATCA